MVNDAIISLQEASKQYRDKRLAHHDLKPILEQKAIPLLPATIGDISLTRLSLMMPNSAFCISRHRMIIVALADNRASVIANFRRRGPG